MEAKARKEASNLSYLAVILRKHLSFWKKHSTKWRSLYNRQSTGHGLEPLLRDISSNGFCPISTVCQVICLRLRKISLIRFSHSWGNYSIVRLSCPAFSSTQLFPIFICRRNKYMDRGGKGAERCRFAFHFVSFLRFMAANHAVVIFI